MACRCGVGMRTFRSLLGHAARWRTRIGDRRHEPLAEQEDADERVSVQERTPTRKPIPVRRFEEELNAGLGGGHE